jgi:hypothetical protein
MEPEEELAIKIVDHLLTTLWGKGNRLAIMKARTFLGREDNLGGWSRGAAIESVRAMLSQNKILQTTIENKNARRVAL